MVYARSPSPSQRPAPTKIASRSPFSLGFSSVRPRSAKWEHRRPKGPQGTAEMGGGIRRPKTLLFENAKWLKTLIRSHCRWLFYFNHSDSMHIRANSFDLNAHRRSQGKDFQLSTVL